MKMLKEAVKVIGLIILTGIISIALLVLMALSYRPPHEYNPKVKEAIQKYNHTIKYDNQDE